STPDRAAPCFTIHPGFSPPPLSSNPPSSLPTRRAGASEYMCYF
ncbi:unnamed protein product, partial [Musa hybrid cultivar]